MLTLQFDCLERRDAAAVVVPGYLTYSFVPDGTPVVGGPSVSGSTMDVRHPAWRDAVRRAIREWASALGLAVGELPDSDPSGPVVRVGVSSVPGSATLAWAYFPCPCPQGSDITFNSSHNWNVIDVYSVALHELGHAVPGLRHGDSPVMDATYRGPVSGLTPADVDAAKSNISIIRSPVWVLSKGP